MFILKKSIFVCGIIQFLSSAVIAQAPGQIANNYLNNYVQPAPNAASLGKYADYPVSYYTGVPQISIPLYNLVDGTINLPISLSYHASGIRVSENASWVGLGWALNAGGVITRTVRGAPDEGSFNHYNAAGPQGYYSDSGLRTMPLLPYPDQFVNNQAEYFNFSSQFIPAVVTGAKDCEPDLYTFNFNGHTGKFVFDENQHARLLTDDDITITVSYSDHSFNSWKITTPDGIQYYFGENNNHEVTYPHSSRSGEDANGKAPSSWYLTRIVNPNTKETATFTYAVEGYSYRDLGPESTLYGTTVGGTNDIAQSCNLSNIGGVPDMITTGVFGLRLATITTKNYHVDFIATNQRLDLIQGINYGTGISVGAPGGSGPTFAYSLDWVKIYSNSNVCMKQIALGHDYFSSTTNTSAGILSLLSSDTYTINNSPDITDTKRLKLTSVTEYDGSGTLQNPPYLLSYDETLQLPRRLSFDQDHWGFSNNAAGDHNSFFTPNVMGPCTFPSIGGAIRNSQWPDMAAFTLKGIKSPLGVSTSFIYGANNPTSNSDPAAVVGGLRIQQIQATDNVTGKVETRKFNYTAGGILYRQPDQYYLIQLYSEYYHTGNAPVSLNGGYNGDRNTSGLIFNTLRSSQSIVPLQDAQGNHISYPFVTEIFGLNGENGYRIHRYSVQRSNQSESSRVDISKYTATGTVAGNTGTYGSGHFNEIQPQDLLPYNQPLNPTYLYPIVPQQVDVTRGNLIGESTYDASNNLVDSLYNVYSENYHEDYLIRGFKAHRAANINSGGNSYNMDAMAYYKLHTGISHLISTTRISYRNGVAVTETTTNGYESPNHTLKTSDTTSNSNGDVIMNKYYYSFDYANAADGVFSKMKSTNLLLPVSTNTWKNNNLIAGNITQFYDFATSSTDMLIKPQKIYALETAVPLTALQANEGTNWADQQTALLPNAFFKERANFTYDGVTGKASQQQLTNGQVESYLWDYNNTYPIAEAKNADVLSIAYTSFEADGTGNWTISPAARDNTKGITGNSSYLLSIISNNNLSKAGLDAAKTYVVSYWTLNNTPYTISGTIAGYPVKGVTNKGWTYYEHHITGQTTITISGNGNIDEVRLYPSDAQMTTYTYDPLTGLTSSTNAKGETTYYEYDPFQRLMNIRDKDGNILKHMEYHYQQ